MTIRGGGGERALFWSTTFFLTFAITRTAMKTTILFILLLSSFCATSTTAVSLQKLSLLELLYSRDDLSELRGLLEFAGLINYTTYFVQGSTVFVPNNDAYDKLEVGELDQIFQREYFTHTMNTGLHFITAENTHYNSSRDMIDGFQMRMSNVGYDTVRVTRRNSTTTDAGGGGGGGGGVEEIFISPELAFEGSIRNFESREARIVDGDIVTSDCYVHIVDTVLWPPWHYLSPALFLERNKAGDLSLFHGLMVAAGLEEELHTAEIRTMLVVNDDIISNLPVAALDYLNNPGNVDDLRSVLRYHMILPMIDLLHLDMGNEHSVRVQSLLVHHPLTITRGKGGLFVGSIRVDDIYDAFFSMGYAYYIDGLLIPPHVDVPEMSSSATKS